jgi:methyl-accepting chemotaxis protein
MKIQKRLFLGICLMVVALVAVGAVGFGFSNRVFMAQQNMVNDQVRLAYLRGVSDAYLNDVVTAIQQTRNGNSWSWEDGLKTIQTAQSTADDDWKAYMGTPMNKDEKYLASIVAASLDNNKHLMEQLVEAYSAKDAKLLEILATSVLYPSLQPITDTLQKLEDLTAQEIKTESDQTSLLYNSSWIITLGIMGAIILSAFLLGLSLTRGLNRKFGSLVAGLENGIDPLFVSAAQISASSAQAALGVSAAGGSLEQIRSSLRSLQNLEQQTEEHSSRVNRLAEESKTYLVGTQGPSEQAAVLLKNLQENSQKIVQKIQAVEQIAFQANILAMNAAVEAVRMGPAGKEFSVVAEEIRGLAQRCAELARETTHWAAENSHLSTTGISENETLRRILIDSQERLKKLVELFSNLESTHFARKKEIQELQAGFAQMDNTIQAQNSLTEREAAAVDQIKSQSEKLKTLAHQLAAFSGAREETAAVSAPRPSKNKAKGVKPMPAAEPVLKPEAHPTPAVSGKPGWPSLNKASRTGTDDAKVVRIGAKAD